MVRVTFAGCVLGLLLAGRAAAAEPDWSRAGGPLFAVADSPAASAPQQPNDQPMLPPSLQPLDALVVDAAGRHRLDPKLLHALVAVESAYRARAVSSAGAGGLTQLMPSTARSLGVRDRFEPLANLQGGAAYLARQLIRFGDLRLALAAYNAGPERVARLGRVPAFPETEAYVGAVIECYLALAAGRTVRHRGDCRGAGDE